jgi:hypothetical protein
MKRISTTDWIEPHINQHTGPTRPLGSLYSDELLPLGSGLRALRGPGVGGTAGQLKGPTEGRRAGALRDAGQARHGLYTTSYIGRYQMPTCVIFNGV